MTKKIIIYIFNLISYLIVVIFCFVDFILSNIILSFSDVKMGMLYCDFIPYMTCYKLIAAYWTNLNLSV